MTLYTGPKPVEKDFEPMEYHESRGAHTKQLVTRNYVHITNRYACCGTYCIINFHNTVFHRTSHELFLVRYIQNKYMLEAFLTLNEANRVWTRKGWAPTTWHKELTLYSFKLKEVFKHNNQTKLYYRYEPLAKQGEVK